MVTYPFDWKSCELGQCVDIYQGGTPSTNNPLYWGGEIVWVTPSEITKLDSLYIDKSERTITQEGLANSSATLLPKGSILLCTRATIGDIAIAAKPLSTNQGFKNLVCHKEIDNVFFAYLLGTYKNEMISKAFGTTFLEVSKKEIEKIIVHIPPYEEQKKIAQTLSDFDTYINDLEKLIEKKKNIRDGALEDLMSQKTRLKGYTNQWEIKTINQIADRYDNLRIPVTSNLRKKGKTPYYGANGVLDYIDGYTHDGEFVLIAEDGATDLKKYPVNYVNGKVWVNNHAHVLKGKNGVVNTKFLFYALQKVDFESILVGGTRSKLNSKSLTKIELTIPSIREQIEIANILENINYEITCLEIELDKIIHIRNGAMDDLLTGRIRLTD